MSMPLQASSDVENKDHQPPKWVKRGNTWVWWDGLFIKIEARVINENAERQLLIETNNDLQKGGHSVTLLPKYIIEDLYKELVTSEVNEVKNELELLKSVHDQCPVELSESDEDHR